MTSIYQALTAVMQDVGAVKKGDRNSAQNFSFRGIDAVTSAVYPALVKHGVVVVPEVLEYEYGTVTVGQRRTEMGHVRLRVKYTWYGPEGDSVVSSAAAESMDAGDKATAKAHSVAFRTALLQTLCLPTDEPDPDSHSYERAEKKSDEELAQEDLLELCTSLGLNPAVVAQRFKDEIGADIRGADAASIRAFADVLRKEGAAS